MGILITVSLFSIAVLVFYKAKKDSDKDRNTIKELRNKVDASNHELLNDLRKTGLIRKDDVDE